MTSSQAHNFLFCLYRTIEALSTFLSTARHRRSRRPFIESEIHFQRIPRTQQEMRKVTWIEVNDPELKSNYPWSGFPAPFSNFKSWSEIPCPRCDLRYRRKDHLISITSERPQDLSPPPFLGSRQPDLTRVKGRHENHRRWDWRRLKDRLTGSTRTTELRYLVSIITSLLTL